MTHLVLKIEQSDADKEMKVGVEIFAPQGTAQEVIWARVVHDYLLKHEKTIFRQANRLWKDDLNRQLALDQMGFGK